MKDFSLESLFAITRDMLGALFWPAIIASVIIALAFVAALIRQRGFRGPAARRAAIIGLAGALAAMAISPPATQADFANLHGVVDFVTLALIGFAAFAGLTIAAYAALGNWRPA
jgi:hypothetical protein